MDVRDPDCADAARKASPGSKPKHVTPIKILIADNHALLSGAIKKLLEKEPDFQVVGEARRGVEIQAKLATLHPDVLLLDLTMTPVSGLDILRNLAGGSSDVRVIILASEMNDEELIEALRLGARGFVMKEMASQLLYRSIRAVMSGEYWVDRGSVGHLVRALRVFPHQKRGTEFPNNNFGLTARELQILSTIVDGCTNKDIAEKFSISEQTVKHHLTNIFDKVNVTNRLELALFAMNNRLVPGE